MFKSSDVVYWKPSKFNSISRIFGMGLGLRFNCLFKFRKSLKNLTQFVFNFGCAKEGAPHLDSFASSGTPKLTSILTSFLNIALCTFGTGYGHDHTGFASYFNSKYNGILFHVPNVPSNRSSNFFRRCRSLWLSVAVRCWHFLVITLFRSAFFYFASNILCILHVEFIVLSDLRHSLTYKLTKDSSYLKIYLVYI